MKITGPSKLNTPGVGQGGPRPAQGGFSLQSAEEASAPAMARSTGVSGVGSIDALIALQQVEEPMGRRKRAVGRAGRMLDVLDKVKLALIDGAPDAADLQRLAAAVREERAAIDDPGLEGLLDQIETRAAVEMAKLEMRRDAA